MGKKQISEIYHQQTKYYESEMGKYQKPLNWADQPALFKEFHSENKIDLVPYLPLKNNPFTGEPIHSQTEEGGYPFGLGAISRLLYFTNGITGMLQYPSGQSLTLRAAPSAGGLYPTEIYIAVRDLSYLQDGVYNFQVKDHSLVLVWEGDFWSQFQKYCLGHKALAEARLLMIFTSVYQRSAWRYHERAYRRILLDTGHVLGNLVAYAHEEGFIPYPLGRFIDPSLNRLLFLDEAVEGVLNVIPLPQQTVSDYPYSTSAIKERTISPLEAVKKIDPLLLQLHLSSSLFSKKTSDDTAGLSSDVPAHSSHPVKEVPSTPFNPISLEEAMNWEGGIAPTILLRRSTRSYTGDAFEKEELACIIEYAYHPAPSTSPPLPSLPLFDLSLLETYVVVQQVKGLAQGVYDYAPLERRLRLHSAGNFSQQTWHFCLGQELARDAAALVIHVSHLKEGLARHGDRAYRYLHLDAGHLGQRMNLAAIRLGLGVSGIGGFYDDEVNTLLGLSLDHIIVYITTLGMPHDAPHP